FAVGLVADVHARLVVLIVLCGSARRRSRRRWLAPARRDARVGPAWQRRPAAAAPSIDRLCRADFGGEVDTLQRNFGALAEFLQKKARHRVERVAAKVAQTSVTKIKLFFRARHADEHQPAFFFNVFFVAEAPFVRQDALLQSENMN